MFVRACMICCALAAPARIAAQPQRPVGGASAYQTLREARRLFDSGQYRLAEHRLRQSLAAIDTKPVPAPAAAGHLELLARVYQESSQYGEALRVGVRYQALLDASASRDQASGRQARVANLAMLSDLYLALGQLDRAEESLRRALGLVEKSAPADPLWQSRIHLSLARVFQQRGTDDDAKAELALAAEMAAKAQKSLPAGQKRAAVELLAESHAAAGESVRAAEVWQALAQELKADDPQRGDLLAKVAACHHAAGDVTREKVYLLQAIELQTQLDKGKPSAQHADLIDRLALACQTEGDDAQAREHWQQAAALYEALGKLADGSDQERARRMQHFQALQLIYQRLGQWSDGARVTRLLLEYRQRVLLPGDPAIARARSALGAFLGRAEDYAAARAALEESAAFWRKRSPPAVSELAGTLNNLAEVERAVGDFPAAERLLTEAAPLYEQILPPHDLKLAEIQANLASVLSAQGQFKAALDKYRQAEEICRKQEGEPSPRVDEVLSTTLLNMAMLYKSQRQFGQAAEYCQQALKARRRSAGEADQGLLPHYLALASLHLAQLQSSGVSTATDLAQASVFVQLALSVCEQHQLLQRPVAANVRYLAGAVDFHKGNLAAARDNWSESLKIARANGLMALQAKCLNYLSEAAVKGGALEEADRHSAEAVALQESLQAYPALHFVALLNRAQLLKRLGREDEAIALLQKAVRLTEAPRAATVGAEAERAEYFAQFSAAFDLLVDWSIEAGALDQALAYAESGRNRTFLDQVRAAGVDLRASLQGTQAESLLDTEREVLAEYNRAVSASRQLLANDPLSADVERLARDVERLRESYADLQTQIRDASPFYREVLRQEDGAATPQVREQLLRTAPLAIVYYLGNFHSHLLVIGREGAGITHYPLIVSPELAAQLSLEPGPLTRVAAAHLVNRFLTLVRAEPRVLAAQRGLGGQTIKSAKLSMTPAEAVALTEVLLPEAVRAEVRRARAEHVVVVPDGALHQLPLEALPLRVEPPEYLLDSFPPIAYAPSATILTALRDRAATGLKAAPSLLTVGNPRYPEADGPAQRSAAANTLARYLALGGQLSPLPSTVEECHKVAESFQGIAGEQVVVLEDVEATEGNVRAQLGGRKYLHLAAHGLVDQQNENLFGAIALTQPLADAAVTTSDDGFLSLYEIHALPVAGCELAILSACQTNVGPERPLEAGSTLARAFLAAGARRVVSSHWNVDDESTSALIGDFAARLAAAIKEGQAPEYAVSLNAARRAVRQNPQWSAPYYWAPFVLIGPAR